MYKIFQRFLEDVIEREKEREREGARFRERNLSRRELCQVLAICRLSTGPSGNQTYRGAPVYRCQPKTAEFAVVLRT